MACVAETYRTANSFGKYQPNHTEWSVVTVASGVIACPPKLESTVSPPQTFWGRHEWIGHELDLWLRQAEVGPLIPILAENLLHESRHRFR